MHEDVVTERRLKVRKHKIAIDILYVMFLVFVGVAIIIETAINKRTTNLVAIVAVLPLTLAMAAIRTLTFHLQASRMFIGEHGIEIRHDGVTQLIRWKEVTRLSERRNFSGGLTIYNQTRKALCIPFVVEDYAQVRHLVITKARDAGLPHS